MEKLSLNQKLRKFFIWTSFKLRIFFKRVAPAAFFPYDS